ncbi:MAG: hypothetical protein DHS20C21_20140 [Gemmatimonadota bacterium]|nr:MAG: hypothetical protein DHS20C21_20140 [Gemmatimonadota bacterium]
MKTPNVPPVPHPPQSSQPPQAPVAYWEYLQLPTLLDIQGGVSRDEKDLSQDEVVFIAVHQVYELWLKLMLRDLVSARDLFAAPHVPDDAMSGASRLLARIRTILELGADHFRLVESITPRDFLNFRDNLFPASGGQSVQFREIEILFGLEEHERIPYITQGTYQDVLHEADGSEGWAMARVKARIADTPTLKNAIDEWLHRTPINGSKPDDAGDREVVHAFVEEYLGRHETAVQEMVDRACAMVHGEDTRNALRRRYGAELEGAGEFLRALDVPEGAARERRQRIRAAALFIEIYRELPLLAWPREVVDGLVAVEQAYVVFRQRHARMVERIIGRRVGTGGSKGVDFLDEGARRYRIFKDLWAARTILVRRDLLPGPTDPDYYGFHFDEA